MKTKPATPVDAMLRAVSDRTRLRILNLLRDGELCVCHIVDVLGVPQPTASRHLAYLRRARLVMARKEGLWSYYRLTPGTNQVSRKLLDCLTSAGMPEFATDGGASAASLGERCALIACFYFPQLLLLPTHMRSRRIVSLHWEFLPKPNRRRLGKAFEGRRNQSLLGRYVAAWDESRRCKGDGGGWRRYQPPALQAR